MLVRGSALCRLTADGSKTSPHHFPHLTRHLQSALPMRNAANGSSTARNLWRARAISLNARRSMATTATAVKPTETVKKAVKAKAAASPAPKTATKKAGSTTKAKSAAAAKKKKTTTTKTRKAAAKKPAAKKKKKVAAKKPAAKKRVKKELTPEQKLKVEVAHLRKVALREPVTPSSLSAFNLYVAQNSHKAQDLPTAQERLTAVAKSFKDLSPAELEHYNHLAAERTAAKRAEYKAWVESHTPDQIRLANNARRLLRKKLVNKRKSGHPARTEKLIDERVPKSPASAYIHFVTERFTSGDFKGIPVTEAAKLAANEWKALSAGEKQKYIDKSKAESERYRSAMEATAAA
ncbi:hypothetical protein IAQ61_005945 [Plenodomus lingam]|nr:hypothetical protein IAQ61_005945 [Plenodomus lingam]